MHEIGVSIASWALRWSAFLGATVIVEGLLKRGANPNLGDFMGRHALYKAIEGRRPHIVELLLKEHQELLASVDALKLSPLVCAYLTAVCPGRRICGVVSPEGVNERSLRVLQILLDFGALTQCRDNILTSAVRAADHEIVRLLLVHGADLDEIDLSGKSARQLIQDSEDSTLVQMCNELRAD